MLSTFGCLSHLSYFTNWQDIKECKLKKQSLKRTRSYSFLGGNLKEEDFCRNSVSVEKQAKEDHYTQLAEKALQYEVVNRKGTISSQDFIFFTENNLSFCCFDPNEDCESCDNESLQQISNPGSVSGVVFLPFRSIFVSYRCPSKSVPPTFFQKTPLLSSPSMESICSPLMYSYEFLPLSDTSCLYLQRWTKLENNTRLVLVVHDVGSYGSFACLRLIPTLLNAGYDLVTFDLRGHGRSLENEGDEFTLECGSNHEIWSSDLHRVIFHLLDKSENPEKTIDSLYLYGEGFGASIILNYVVRYAQEKRLPWQLKGVIACGVMLRQIPSKYNIKESSSRIWKQLSRRQSIFENFLLFQKFLWLLGVILPSTVCKMRVDPTQWGLVPLDFSLLSRDLRVIEALRADSHRLREIAFKHVFTLWKLCHQLDKVLKREIFHTLCPNVSFGFFHGGDDVLSPLSNLSFIENNKHLNIPELRNSENKRVQVYVYDKARHYLAHETLPVRRQFLDDLKNWLDQQESPE